MTYSFFNYNAHNMPNLVQQEGKQTNLSNSSVIWYRKQTQEMAHDLEKEPLSN